MKITLLKSFALRGFKGEVREDGSYIATDNSGKELKEGVDYLVDDIDIPEPLIIVLSTGEIIELRQNKKG